MRELRSCAQQTSSYRMCGLGSNECRVFCSLSPADIARIKLLILGIPLRKCHVVLKPAFAANPV